MDEVSSRRGLFKLAGAVATGAVAHTILSASPAAAGDQAGTQINGNAVELGEVSTSTTETGVVRTSSTAGAGFKVVHASSVPGTIMDGVRGEASGSSAGAGVFGRAPNGYGLIGDSDSGYSVYATGVSRIGMDSHSISGPVSGLTSVYQTGDIVRDSVGSMFACVTGGTGSAAVFRKLAGPSTAGQLHLLDPARRAYDSRASQVPPSSNSAAQGGQGAFGSGITRTVSLAISNAATGNSPLVPTGAVAALVVVSVFSITGDGYLKLYPGATEPNTLNVFWGNVPALQTANTTIVKLTSLREFTVKAALSFGSVDAAIDVVGYYL